MPDFHNRTTENEFAEAVLEILANSANGEMSYAELIAAIPKHIELTKEDLSNSDTRDNEELWEQRVRNITSHQKSPNNYIALGFLEPIYSGLKITEMGKRKFQSNIS